MSKHTPGPWIVVATASDFRIGRTAGAEKRKDIVAFIDASFINAQRTAAAEANARLIAASPDLLTSLKEAVRLLRVLADERVNPNYIDIIAQPIAKAEGRE